MRVFKNAWFSQFADKEGITDSELKEMGNLLQEGQSDADLGGGVFKMRLARPGEGKSGGYRVIVFYKSRNRTFYAYGFTKAGMDNINEKQLRDFKRMAKIFFEYTESQLDEQVKSGIFMEF